MKEKEKLETVIGTKSNKEIKKASLKVDSHREVQFVAKTSPPEHNNLETMGLSQNHKEIRGDVILFAGSEEHQKETKTAKKKKFRKYGKKIVTRQRDNQRNRITEGKIINLSSVPLTLSETNLLRKGLTFCPKGKVNPSEVENDKN